MNLAGDGAPVLLVDRFFHRESTFFHMSYEVGPSWPSDLQPKSRSQVPLADPQRLQASMPGRN